MSRMKTWLTTSFAFLAITTSVHAQDIVQTFATCTGRLSAQMEHEWLMNDPASERTETHRATMIALLDAVSPPNRGRDILAWRIDAKSAHAMLLTRATFNDDTEDAAWALRRAQTQVSACTGLLLS